MPKRRKQIQIFSSSDYTVGRNAHGNPQIIFNNYTFNFHHKNVKKNCQTIMSIYWTCSTRATTGCTAAVSTNKGDGTLIMRGTHNH